jgi:hypothetical protein
MPSPPRSTKQSFGEGNELTRHTLSQSFRR